MIRNLSILLLLASGFARADFSYTMTRKGVGAPEVTTQSIKGQKMMIDNPGTTRSFDAGRTQPLLTDDWVMGYGREAHGWVGVGQATIVCREQVAAFGRDPDQEFVRRFEEFAGGFIEKNETDRG